jgi:hypothetical protein
VKDFYTYYVYPGNVSKNAKKGNMLVLGIFIGWLIWARK